MISSASKNSSMSNGGRRVGEGRQFVTHWHTGGGSRIGKTGWEDGFRVRLAALLPVSFSGIG